MLQPHNISPWRIDRTRSKGIGGLPSNKSLSEVRDYRGAGVTHSASTRTIAYYVLKLWLG